MENQPTNQPIIFFDGVCNLCNASVKLVLKADRKKIFRFSSLQSEFAKSIPDTFRSGDPVGGVGGSIVLFYNGSYFVCSDAVLEICNLLCYPWRVLYFFKWVPRPIRDGFYKFIARNRYKIFGKKSSCMLPDAPVKERFL